MPKRSRGPVRSSRQLALDLLQRWRGGEGFAADLMTDAFAQTPPPAPRDRALVQNMFYGVLRQLRLLDHWIGELRPTGRLGADERDLLRLGLCQVLVLGMPDHAAVDTTVACAGRARGLVNAVLRRAIRERGRLLEDAAQSPPALRWSHPDWLFERWNRQFGRDAADALCQWNQQPAPVWLRLNRLAPPAPPAGSGSTEADWPDEVRQAVATGAPAVDLATLLGPLGRDFAPVDRLPRDALDAGLVYAQDPSTAAACRLLDPQPGDTVIDGCAAPGGKTALLWQLMERRGRLVACDLAPQRLQRLGDNLSRLGAGEVELRAVDWTAPGAVSAELPPADRLLLDVPCSNTGVMRRRIDVRWRLDPGQFTELQALQLAIVAGGLRRLRTGGILVYSTCSLDAEENEQVVQQLPRRHPGLTLEQVHATRPWLDRVDGSFAARFVWHGPAAGTGV